ncbi:MAG: flavin reductase family protein [Bacteroidales bacterium]|nr:flavin reductase family protein [Bacteroidales bacterium]
MIEGKKIWKPGNMLYPLPVVMVTCGSEEDGYNIITIAWTGTINNTPPMVSISVRPERYSYDLIKKHMAFTINLVNQPLLKAADFCGVKSGRDMDKFKTVRLTPIPGVDVPCPIIAESPMSLECKVTQIIELGSHHMFVAEVINSIADDRFFNPRTKKFDLENAGLVSYNHGGYYEQGDKAGKFGYSVQKKK